MEKQISYDPFQHAFEILEELDKLRKSNQCCDFMIKVGDQEIHANRGILCANSEYFRAMFSHNTLENETGIVELEDLDPDCVSICADFMYGREISIAREKWEHLILCADRLELVKLMRFIEKFLEDSLAPDTFYDIWRISKTFSFNDLREACDKFAPENFDTISQLDEFLSMENETVLSIVTSSLNKASHTNRMRAILNWIKFDGLNRSGYLFEMLNLLDLSQIPAHYLRFLLEKDPLMSESFECSKLLSFSIMDTFCVSAANADPVGDDIDSVLVFDEISHHLQCFNPKIETWTQMQAIHPDMKKDNFSAVALHQYLFAFMNDNRVLRLKLADEDAIWEQVTSVPGKHGKRPCVVADSRYIYAVGLSGWFVDKYDTILDKWSRLGGGKAACGSSCVLFDRKIYCFGGDKPEQCTKTVHVFDLDSNSWNTVSSFSEEREYFGASIHCNNIHVIGGEKDGEILSLSECYDPETDTWISMPPLLEKRTLLPVVTIGDQIVAVGRYGDPSGLVQTYEIKNKKWKIFVGKSMKVLWCVGVHSAR